MEIIDIPRAIEDNRKITFQEYKNWALIYSTDFGEIFSIPIWRIFFRGIRKIETASEFESFLNLHNKRL